MKLHIHEHGFEIKIKVVSDATIESILNEVGTSSVCLPMQGVRGADKKFQSIDALAQSEEFVNLANTILGSKPCIVRVILFDKSFYKNWFETWHQDKTVALDKKVEAAGWGPWSFKDRTHHVQPPLEVLNKMVIFHLHLDDANENNGCLKVIPKSHELGILSHPEITEVVSTQEPYLCEVKKGDLMLMKPLVIHSSGKSEIPDHRRVVHIEYSNYPLPQNLKWA